MTPLWVAINDLRHQVAVLEQMVRDLRQPPPPTPPSDHNDTRTKTIAALERAIRKDKQ